MNAVEHPRMSRQPALTGRRMNLRSWGPGSPLAPPRSPHIRLVVGVFGLVLVMAAVMSVFSTASLRHMLMACTGSQLMAAVQRAVGKRRDLTQEARKVPDEAAQEDMKNQGDQPDEAAGAGGGPDKPGVPPNLSTAGQSIGTLTLITPQASSSDGETNEVAIYINKNGHYASVFEEDCRLLLSQATEDHLVTVDLHYLSSYRVVVTRDEASDGTAIAELSLEGGRGLIRIRLLIGLAMALVGALVIALARWTMVRFALVPSERVAHTAHRVTSQPLERGEVSIEDRVEKTDLDSSTEVGQVDGVLNALLGYVESALTVRQRSETQVCQFAADTSHELHAPLAPVRGYTELTRHEGADVGLPEEVTYALGHVHPESVRVTAFVEDLLLLARLDARREPRREEVDLVGLLTDTVADARAAGPDRDWQLDLTVLEPPADATPEGARDFLPEPPLVIGDEARLRQVIVSLLANARAHTLAGSHATTTLAREESTLVICIHNDGPGIAPDVCDHLFEHSARGDSSREWRIGSTDLDTSVALVTVQSHGRSINVASSTTPENYGITSGVRFPAATAEE